MTDQHGVGGADDEIGAADGDVSAADERALRALFAALVEDADPSGLNPLDVQRLARAEQRSSRERRVKRRKVTRNALIAAVLVGVVVLVAPHLSTSSSTTAAASSASVAAAAPSDGRYAASATGAAGGGVPRSAAADSSAAAASAPTNAGAGPRKATGGSAHGSSASSAASSSAAAAGVESSGAVDNGALRTVTATSASAGSSGPASSGAASALSLASCPPLTGSALAVVRAALPGYRGTVRIASCTTESSAGSKPGSVTFAVSRSGSSACVATSTACPQPPAAPIPGIADVYGFSGGVVVTGSNGLTVTATATAGGPDRTALIAAARALLKTLR